MRISLVVKCAVVCAVACTLRASAPAQNAYLLPGNGNFVHIMPTPEKAQEINAVQPPQGPLLYNGGPVMTGMTTYAIFWNGNGNGYSAKYESLAKQFLADYPAHGVENNSTQYYQVVGKTTTYIKNVGAFGGFYDDTTPFPTGGCNDPITGRACVTDAQIQAEVTKVMNIKHWTAGLGKMFLVFTSSGEGSCASFGCAYSDYCAYHGYFLSGTTPTIYGNMPYADPNYCYASGTQQDPNGDIPADANVNVTSHEMTEANTDPELNAWFTAGGEEIGDLCAWTFGADTWDGGLANQMWNGHFYDLQLEYDNHAAGCVQVGP